MRSGFECSASPTALAHRRDEGVSIVWMPRIRARVKRPGPSRRPHHPLQCIFMRAIYGARQDGGTALKRLVLT